MNTYARTRDGRLRLPRAMSEAEILKVAEDLIEARYARETELKDPADARELIRAKLIGAERELFLVLFLDQRHRLIASEVMFQGTIDQAEVQPREVVKRALHHNASALIMAHNHPSGYAEPSTADMVLTKRLQEALALVQTRLLDHIVVGYPNITSMAERGML